MSSNARRSVLLLTLATASLATLLVLPRASGRMSPWKDAALLALPLGADLEKVHVLLRENGVRNAVSAHSQTLSIAGFGQVETFPLERLDNRLLPDDPRRDLWTDSLMGYFRARMGRHEYSLVYLPRLGLGALPVADLLRKMEGSFMVEGRADWGLLPPILVFLCASWILFLRPSFFPKALLVSAPWALASFESGTGQALVSMAGALTSVLYAFSLRSWPFQLERGDLRGRLRAIGSEAGILSAALAPLSFLLAFSLNPSWRAVAAIPASFAFAALCEGRMARRRTTHRPFVPLAIKARTASGRGRLSAPWSIQAAVMGLASLLIFGLATTGRGWEETNGALSIPHPDRYTRSQASVDILPGYDQFAAHAERQVSFMRRRLGEGQDSYREAILAHDGTIRGMRDVAGGRGDPRLPVDGMAGLLKAEGKKTIVSGSWSADQGMTPRDASAAFFLILIALPAFLRRRVSKWELEGCEPYMKSEAERKSA